jgi:hypothetical protein
MGGVPTPVFMTNSHSTAKQPAPTYSRPKSSSEQVMGQVAAAIS